MNLPPLNPEQMQAVRHRDGPMMVLAGPGSGKTTTITCRVLNLIEQYGIDPRQIYVITFTRAAADEMKNRFELLSGGKYARVSFGTFHALFYRILRSRSSYDLDHILKDDQRRALLLNIVRHFQLTLENEEDSLQNLSNEISRIQNDLMDIQFYHSTSLGTAEFQAVFRAYEEYKREQGFIDFDDMLVRCWQLLNEDPALLKQWRSRYDYILIDEFQDINRVQYESIRLLAAPQNNLFIVGDDDQSIYRFRGAGPEFFQRFPKDLDPIQQITLCQNYRSTDQIIRLAGRVIAQNQVRYEKETVGTARQGPKPIPVISEDITREARKIAALVHQRADRNWEETAVIYRTNIQARALVDAFMDQHIPFQLKEKTPSIYEHWTAGDVCAYFRLALDRTRDSALERILNKPARYMSKALLQAARKQKRSLLDGLYELDQLPRRQRLRLDELLFYLDALKKRTPYEAIRYLREAVGYDIYIRQYAEYRKIKSNGFFETLDELQESARPFQTLGDYLSHVDHILSDQEETGQDPHGVVFTTMHGAKGLEFETVFIVGAVEGLIPHEKSRTEAEIEEERRLFYVAITRAKTNLYISLPKTRYEKEVQPTRFLPVSTAKKQSETIS